MQDIENGSKNLERYHRSVASGLLSDATIHPTGMPFISVFVHFLIVFLEKPPYSRPPARFVCHSSLCSFIYSSSWKRKLATSTRKGSCICQTRRGVLSQYAILLCVHSFTYQLLEKEWGTHIAGIVYCPDGKWRHEPVSLSFFVFLNFCDLFLEGEPIFNCTKPISSFIYLIS